MGSSACHSHSGKVTWIIQAEVTCRQSITHYGNYTDFVERKRCWRWPRVCQNYNKRCFGFHMETLFTKLRGRSLQFKFAKLIWFWFQGNPFILKANMFVPNKFWNYPLWSSLVNLTSWHCGNCHITLAPKLSDRSSSVDVLLYYLFFLSCTCFLRAF